jgi:hypothetical protein
VIESFSFLPKLSGRDASELLPYFDEMRVDSIIEGELAK